jgi:PadR family transcriptional regulator PadR
MYELTKNEELILLSIWKLKDNAYGVTIRGNFKKITGKTLNFGSLYNTLYLLVRRGLVESKESKPLSRQGGRRKILYSMTREGEKALSNAQRVHKLAWDDVPDYSFEKKK